MGNKKKRRFVGKYDDKTISVNQMVKDMKPKDILDIRPYRTLTYYSQNVDIFITIDQLEEFLNFFGYKYDKSKYEKQNISKKERGVLNDQSKQKLSKIYKKDILFYNKVITK